jgi:hypothetical protein
VDEMSALGLDGRELPHAILSGEQTDLRTLYRICWRADD